MSGQLDCYEDYLALEGIFNKLRGILLLSFIPSGRVQRNGKFIVLSLILIIAFSNFSAMLKPDVKQLSLLMAFMTFSAQFKLLSKVSVTSFQQNDLNGILEWIRSLHFVPNCAIMRNSAEIHLKKTPNIFKIVLRIFPIVYFITIKSVVVYFIATDTVLFAIPGLSTADDYFPVTHTVQFTFSVIFGVLLVTGDCLIIFVALYFIPALNIFLDCISSLNDSSVVEKEKDLMIYLHLYHLKIIRNLKAFSNLYYYTFILQMGANFICFLFSFFLLAKSYDTFCIYPLIITIFLQFSSLCIFGEFIFSKTERIFRELYLTKWYEFSKENQKILLMMMMMSQNPFGFKAAGMYDLNLLMLIRVVKFSVSVCTVLYALT